MREFKQSCGNLGRTKGKRNEAQLRNRMQKTSFLDGGFSRGPVATQPLTAPGVRD